MKIIENNIIPFKGFLCINIYGILFVRKENYQRKNEESIKLMINHESIHTAQMKDFCKFLPIGGTIFYIVYFCEWLYRIVTPPILSAYKDISFEKEAYSYMKDSDYLINSTGYLTPSGKERESPTAVKVH
jgi:hypothetical protein